jgi:hypothetical protein
MTKDDKKNTAASPLSGMIEAMQAASANMMPMMGPEWMANMTTLGTEMMEFMAQRIKEDLQTQQDMLQAKDILEVQKIQAEFVKKAMDDYSTEMTKLMGMGGTHERHATPV